MTMLEKIVSEKLFTEKIFMNGMSDSKRNKIIYQIAKQTGCTVDEVMDEHEKQLDEAKKG